MTHREMLLHILHRNGPKLMLAKMDLQEGKITKADFMAETAAAMRNVKLATKCFENSNSQPS